MNYCIKEDKSNKRNYRKDVKVGGMINMVLFLLFIIITNYYTYSKGIFQIKFKFYHWILWNLVVVGQIIYIFYILFFKENLDKYNKQMYRFFTEGGIKNYVLMVKEADDWPLYDLGFILLFLLIPSPFMKELTWTGLIEMALSKIGFYHILNKILTYYLKNYINIEENKED